MTDHTGRLYSLALALVLFFVLWAGIAARPWVAASPDPKVAALVVREQHLRRDSVLVRKVVARRWAVYRVQLDRRKAAIAAARKHQRELAAAAVRAASVASVRYSSSPSHGSSYSPSAGVRIVNLPPLTITRTS